MSNNLVRHDYAITKIDREKCHGHSASLLWFTGLSGSGKSTLANLVEVELHKLGLSTYSLDGDNIRQGINKDLSFNPKDRTENIRRIAEIGKLMVDAGLITLAAFVSPYRADRENIKHIVGREQCIEIYINTSLEECERRDVKGLYKKARAGEITNFTGIDDPYEAPENPEIHLHTDEMTLEQEVQIILDHLHDNGFIQVREFQNTG